MSSAAAQSFWMDRLDIPTYRVSEAARYARTSVQTVGRWQKIRGNYPGVVAPRRRGTSLSYLQLIEVGVVAAMRKSGLPLSRIRQAREYLSDEFNSHFPFAQYRFKTDGKSLFMSYDQIAGSKDKDKLLAVNENGQLAWNEILRQRLLEFEYDQDLGTVLTWKVDGLDSPIRVDPRIAFGAPQVDGIPTWILRERWHSGESLTDIADDYRLETQAVASALHFEGVEIDPDRPNLWVH